MDKMSVEPGLIRVEEVQGLRKNFPTAVDIELNTRNNCVPGDPNW